jgi:hypothetical protein
VNFATVAVGLASNDSTFVTGIDGGQAVGSCYSARVRAVIRWGAAYRRDVFVTHVSFEFTT